MYFVYNHIKNPEFELLYQFDKKENVIELIEKMEQYKINSILQSRKEKLDKFKDILKTL